VSKQLKAYVTLESFQKLLLVPRILPPGSSDAPSHPGVHLIPETSAPHKINSATGHPWSLPSVTLRQQIIHDLRLQLRILITLHVHNVKRPPA